MAKIFKTISLEERWKGSSYSNKPTLPSSVKQGQSPVLNIVPATVEQGGVDLKIITPRGESPTAQLKLMVDPIKKNSEVLKAMIKVKGDQALPTPQPLNTKALSTYAVPFTNTQYRTTISLADRLGQTKLGTTKYLPQYFLSDVYTDYIKTVPFGIFNHTSNILVQPFNFVPQQGGQNPVIPTAVVSQGGQNPTTITFNSLFSQGVIISSGLLSSIINTTTPPTAGTLTFDPQINVVNSLIAGAYTTIPQITPVIPSSAGTFPYNPQIVITNSQGPNAYIDPQITPFMFLGIVPTVSEIQSLQGPSPFMFLGMVSTVSEILLSQGSAPTLDVPVFNRFSSIIYNGNRLGMTQENWVRWETAQKDYIDPSKKINQGSVILNVLAYEAQRSLAFFTPRVVHGSSNLTNQETKPGYFQDNPTDFSILYSNGQESNRIDSPSYIAKVLGKTDGEDEVGNLVNELFSPNSKQPKANVEAYKTLTYDQIAKRAKDKSEGKALTDFRDGLNLKGVIITNYTDLNNTVEGRGVTPGDRLYENDFVQLRVKSIRDNTTTYFRAFITNFSDNISPTWTDINYIGRQDTLKAFKGVTRNGSIAFKVAALRKKDLEFNYFKLNELIKSAGVGSATSGDTYIKGPLCKITVGNWFKDTPVVFNSIKYDVQMAEYSWEVAYGKQVPHIVDVSLDFSLIGDIKGDPLNAELNDYFNYKGA